ncbi:MAG: PBP1A family penicillin-binding protein [Armatimonadetes bacterium]|nr:PBP1A family penicillin-binding protein [Armatimonadota bacterium]
MRTHRFHQRLGRTLRYANAIIIALTICGVGFVAGAVERIRETLPEPEKLASYRPSATTEIYSTERHADGKVEHTLLARVYEQDRTPVPLKDIPDALKLATIAREDRRFPTHRGVDPKGLLRAARANLPVFAKGGEYVQGGSTITQQLARAIWLSPEKTMTRKLKEILLAIELERRYSKDEILEMYLNEVNYGHGAYGVKRAAEFYFGKQPKDLTLGECALLAGLPQRPSFYSPYVNPGKAKERRQSVLQWMVNEGYVSPREAREAGEEQIQSHLRPMRQPGVQAFEAPYFTRLVIRDLCDKLGSDIVYKGGLRVFTTLDMRVQRAADDELGKGIKSLRNYGSVRSNYRNGVPNGQGALACVEVRTGRVLALSGGVGPFRKRQFYNRAHPGIDPWGRQPGSSFKPYIFSAALETGFGPDSVVSGVESISIGGWHPVNYSRGQGHMWSLRGALAMSVNLVAIRLIQKITVDKAVRYASRLMDIPEARFDPHRYYSLALGTVNLSPLEQASGYAVFANGGRRAKRTYVDRIEDYRGNVLFTSKPRLEQVIKPETAVSMVSMLGGVISSGTGRQAGAVGCPAGGKTGTTSEHRDVWWVGFTPDLSAAVWIGNDDNTPMYGASGGGWCAPIWARFMRRAIDILGCNGQFPQGSGVTGWRRAEGPDEAEETAYSVCEDSGGLATENCPNVKQVKKKGPKPKPCSVHGRPDDEPAPDDAGGREVTVCADSGLRAAAGCPNTVTRRFPPGEGPGGACSVHGASREPEPSREPEAPREPEAEPPAKAPPEPPPPPRPPTEPPAVPSVPPGGGTAPPGG